MIKTITGALRAVRACKSLDDLVALDARVSTVAWNDGGEIRNAIEAKRSALVSVEADGPECDSADDYARAFPALALAASRGESVTSPREHARERAINLAREGAANGLDERTACVNALAAVPEVKMSPDQLKGLVFGVTWNGFGRVACSGCGHPHGGPDCAVF